MELLRRRNEHRYTVASDSVEGAGCEVSEDGAHRDSRGSDTGGQRSGGCVLYVLSLTPTSYRRVASISITRPPIRVLPTITHGWHDLGVLVTGGGIIPGYEARLRFNARSYPSNPTVPPATRLKDTAGKQVIGEEAGWMPKPAP